MPSQFVDHFTRPLIVSRPATPSSSPGIYSTQTTSTTHVNTKKHALHALLVLFNRDQPITSSFVTETVEELEKLNRDASLETDPEEEALKQTVIGKLVIGLYAQALDTYLTQATEVEAEAEWWADIERSRLNVAWYLLQTLPSRIVDLACTIVRKVHARNLPLRISTLSPSSLRILFPSTDAFRPSAFTTVLFPHLAHQPLSTSITTSAFLFRYSSSPSFSSTSAIISSCPLTTTQSILRKITQSTRQTLHFLAALSTFPLTLTRQECRYNRKELERIRDERASVLGELAQIRGKLSPLVEDPASNTPGELKAFVLTFAEIISPSPGQKLSPDADTINPSPLTDILRLSQTILPSLPQSHTQKLRSQRLLRPPRLVLIWPKLLLLPPLAIYSAQWAYASRETLVGFAKDAKETVEGFVHGWLIEPLREVLKTVRASGDEGVIVRKEGVLADLDSLERMTLSLARDELNYNPTQLEALSQKIRVGDLTPVLEIYEEDIRHPLRSALTGTLLRSVFIQVQKAKVDIDQALTGIDKLLKSQELTFAFVGVAPALAIVYLTGGAFMRFTGSAQGRGRYGGAKRRRAVFEAMRRIERLLLSQPSSSTHPATYSTTKTMLSPLSTGLLLLSVTRLRQYADDSLPTHSRLRHGFLEDVADLEDPELGREEKFRVVERMWRCWGGVLGWGIVAGEGRK
ncbi:ATP synthase regulation protein NCA2-domain-containing protein [Crucibulum laeve]|uniref:ATP synthase regulation protein NCA2-domain-containing protein n=1 Tax=Crucibulum laeve TaxID=68775 RepID=A0A5C3MH92_9AGAR|nr:ATP synthase regulation protein NCA2-domain-containing protein [Crucibulum laeve]